MARYQPYKFWRKNELGNQLKRMSTRLGIYEDFCDIIEEAIYSDDWEPIKDFNGCSVVQDTYHPCLSCFIHDYLWLTGQGGKDADYVFYKTMLLEGTSKGKAWRRWFAVRVAWIFYFKWKYISKRNLNEYSKEFSALLAHLKHIK